MNAGDNSPEKDVLSESRGFDFQQAMYLPGESDRIAILSDTLTLVRQRTAESDFRKASVASYGPSMALQSCDVSHDGSLAVTISDDLIPASDEAGGKSKEKLGGEIRIWNIADGKELVHFTAAPGLAPTAQAAK
mgnify:CR=1 FL=1